MEIDSAFKFWSFSQLFFVLCFLQVSCVNSFAKTNPQANNAILVYEDILAAEDPKDRLERLHFNPIVVYNEVDKGKKVLTKFGIHPKIFPSGDKIVYFVPQESPYFSIEEAKHGKSVIVDLSGKVEKEIPFHVTSISPDGTQLIVQPIYQRNPFETGFEIYILDLKTDKVQKVLGLDELPTGSEIESLNSPIWFPDGQKILFLIQEKKRKIGALPLHAFGIVESNGSNFSQISSFMADIRDFDISPDGERLVYTQTLQERDLPFEQLFVMNLDGSQVKQLTKNKTFKYDPIWAPDGNSILFTENRSQPPVTGKQTLMIINEDGSNQRRALPKTWRYYIGLFTPFWTTEVEHNADWWQPIKGQRFERIF